MATNITHSTRAHAGSISRILSGIGLDRASDTARGCGFEVIQHGAVSQVFWHLSSGQDTECGVQAFAKMRDALAPRGYRIVANEDGRLIDDFAVTRINRVLTEDVRRVLNRGRRTYEYTKDRSGFHVEACPTDHQVVVVSFKAAEHTTYGDGDQEDKTVVISRSFGLYATILEEAGYTTHFVGGVLLVGIRGNRSWPSLGTDTI